MPADDEVFHDLPIDPDLGLAEGKGHGRTRGPEGRWDIAVVIAMGGAIGGGLRWLLNETLPRSADGFPWSTFVENVSGCLVLGALMVFLLEVWTPHRYARPFLGVGLLGGFTTFSAYTVETMGLLQSGRAPTAFAYLFCTLVAGLVATWMGIAVARRSAGISSPSWRHRPVDAA